MNKVFMIFTMLILCVISAYSADPTGENVDAAYVWEMVESPYFPTFDSDSTDSLVGNDSIIVCADFSPEPGWQYILVNDALTEGAEAEFVLTIRCLDEDGDILYTASAVDTLADDGGPIYLPFFESIFGSKFKIIIEDGAADGSSSGAATVLNTLKMYRRRPVTGNSLRWGR